MTFLYIIAVLIIAVIGFVVFRLIKVKKQNNKLNEQRFYRIQPLYNKLQSGESLTQTDVQPYVINAVTRFTTFEMLNEQDKLNLFPNEYLNLVHAAESSLINWLSFRPNLTPYLTKLSTLNV